MDLLERLTQRYSDASGWARELASQVVHSNVLPVKTQGAVELAAMPLIDANERLATILRSRLRESSEI